MHIDNIVNCEEQANIMACKFIFSVEQVKVSCIKANCTHLELKQFYSFIH